MEGDSHAIKGSTGRYISSLLISAAIPIVVYIFYRIRADYIGWYNMGRAGMLPHNFFGYVRQCVLRLRYAQERLSTAIYSKPDEIAKGGAVGQRSWLADLTPRSGPRPKVGNWAIPQRQLNDMAPASICEILMKEVAGVIEANPGVLCDKKSWLEASDGAMYIADDIATPHAIAEKVKREIAHVHSKSEHSLHVTVSPVDSVIVIERGWGERLAIPGLNVPYEYLLIYVPRTEEELKVVMEIVRASAAFMTGGKEIV